MKRLNRSSWTILTLTLVSSLFNIEGASAQLSVGIEGGYNNNYIVTNNANRAFTNYQSLNGFSAGIPIQYKITDWFSIATDPSFVQKNYSQQRSAFFVGVYQENHNNYIQLPLMGHFMFGGKKLKGFLNVGLYGGCWITGTVKGVMPNILDITATQTPGSSIYNYQNPYSYNQKYAFDNRKDNRFETGWVGGLGIAYDINNRYQVFTEGRLLYSFTDQQKKYMTNQIPRYNTTAEINAGIMIRLKNPQKSN